MSRTVAIVGAGTAGLCALRACQAEGLTPTVFDSRPQVAGIWSTHDTPVFDSLTTNTACYDTCLSDLPPPRVTPAPHLAPGLDDMCLSANELRRYLESIARIATQKDPTCLRLATRVERVQFLIDHCEVTSVSVQGVQLVESFDHVIVATGYHGHAWMPSDIQYKGLAQFPGGKMHSSQYRNTQQVAGKRVLVVGGSISGCEVAADIAVAMPGRVTLSTRRMRHICVKQRGKRVMVSSVITRYNRLLHMAGMLWDNDDLKEKADVVREFTKYEEVGLPSPEGEFYIEREERRGELNWCRVNSRLVEATESGALEWNVGGIERFCPDGSVVFKDGNVGNYDFVVFATGFRLHLPFLNEETRRIVCSEEAPDTLMDLAHHTLHPDYPRLSFVGIFPPSGPVVPMHDMQARWVARTIAVEGVRPTDRALWEAIERYREQRRSFKSHFVVFGFEVLDTWARLNGSEVDLSAYKDWTKMLIFGPLVPAQFRLCGAGKLETAVDEFERQALAAGWIRGDNCVKEGKLRRLKEICDVLERKGNAPRGLREAVDFLCQVNS